MTFRRALVLPAVALAALGCGPRKPRPREKGEAREWLARRAAEGVAAARAPAWTEPELKPVKPDPLPPPEGDEPGDAGQIVRCLRSRKFSERLLGLTAAWKKRPPEALGIITSMARRDPVFAVPAVQVLAAYPDPAGSRALLAALSSRHADARAAACQALSWRRAGRGGDVGKALLRALRRDRSWRVRAGAARALGYATGGRFGAKAELALAARVRDSEEFGPVRLECAAALARGGVAGGWRCLQDAAASREVGLAQLALGLAAELGGRRGTAILSSALESREPEVWTSAAGLFQNVGRDAALEALAARARAGGTTGRRAVLALAYYEGRRLAPEVVRIMESGAWAERMAACHALARALREAAGPALERKLLEGREHPSVRVAAADALGAVGGAVAAVSLRRVAEGESDARVRAAARDALVALEARIKKRAGKVSAAEAERCAFSRWSLVSIELGSELGCRLRDARARLKDYRIGDEVALGYRLARVLGAGDEPRAAEVLMAGRAAARTDLLRAVLTKGDRAVVLVRAAIKAEGR